MQPSSERPTLVLGGSGFLGAHVCLAAARRGQTHSAARTPPPAAVLERVSYRSVDALAPGGVEHLLERAQPARVVLCTALSRTADCDAYPVLAQALNAELVGRTARSAERLEARFVHVSTDLVFGREPAPPGGFKESDSPGPQNAYGASKLAGEREAVMHHPQAAVVRLPLLYGPSWGRGLGASDQLLAQIERGETPNLFEDEWRTPLDVRAAAEAIVELLHGKWAGLLHVAGPQRCSRSELGLAVLEAAGWDPPRARAALRFCRRGDLGLESRRPADVSLDSSLARGFLATPLPSPGESLAAAPR